MRDKRFDLWRLVYFQHADWILLPLPLLLLLFSSEPPSSFTKFNGGFKHISVGGSSSVWAISIDEDIYRWSGNEWHKTDGAKLKQLSAAEVCLCSALLSLSLSVCGCVCVCGLSYRLRSSLYCLCVSVLSPPPSLSVCVWPVISIKVKSLLSMCI